MTKTNFGKIKNGFTSLLNLFRKEKKPLEKIEGSIKSIKADATAKAIPQRLPPKISSFLLEGLPSTGCGARFPIIAIIGINTVPPTIERRTLNIKGGTLWLFWNTNAAPQINAANNKRSGFLLTVNIFT